MRSSEDAVTITSTSSNTPTKHRDNSISSIPSFSTARMTTSNSIASSGLFERPNSGNATKLPPPTIIPDRPESPTRLKLGPRPLPVPGVAAGSPEKRTSTQTSRLPASPERRLRMQSPQKLRERLQNEARAISTTETSLQAELSKIGDELSGLAGESRKPHASARHATAGAGAAAAGVGSLSRATGMSQFTVTADLKALENKVKALESRIPTLVGDLSKRVELLGTSVSDSLAASEKKNRALEELYKDAAAENEALYARFNEELGKVLRKVKGSGQGDGVEELRQRMQDAEVESAKLRKENARLKRENAGLRAALRD
ncbi:hypothetical protein LTS18_009089 [Coniosporium uncinatum]|uniref:Uncharacterized protein n=1 Tax=Coniosporium uncinatum TaxID=93489 RepID=A0ACC3DMU4_9PEZI|nr:hypothetical protein LTS18_009089 [Coniosporium uncinatum]